MNKKNKPCHIEKKVFSYIEKHNMIVSGDKIVVGVSGGADSVCLLLLLSEYCRRVPISLGVVHVNHGIRADAEEDARYVEKLCGERNIPFYLTEADVQKIAAQEKCSEEDAGRRVRYQAFYRTADEMGGARIAVAHNMGDNAETMLFHLFRGSGLKGLCGIAPVRDNVIHPILCLERGEVEEYLRERRISWRTDSTNGEDHYRRNRIRHHILPYAEREIAQRAAAHMCCTAELLSEAEDYLEQQTRVAWEQCVREQPKAPGESGSLAVREQPGIAGRCISPPELRYTVDVSRFRELHIVLQKRILLGIAKTLSPTGKDISSVHVEDVLSLFEEPGNRDLSLPFGICAGRRYGKVALERREICASRRIPETAGRECKQELPVEEVDPGQQEVPETAGRECKQELPLEEVDPGQQEVPEAAGRECKQELPVEEVDPGQQEVPEAAGRACKQELPLETRNPESGGGWEVKLPAQEQGYPVSIRLENGESLEFGVFFGIKGQEVPRNQYTKWLDYDKIIESPVVRYRKQGDFLTIADREGRLIHKSLKDYMITEKIPREQRGKIPVLAVGSHVLWLVGYRISEYFKISGNTNHILQVQLKKGFIVSETEEENVGTH